MNLHNLKKSSSIGYLFGVICVFFWGISFIVSKGLMLIVTPVQLMWLRFIVAYAALWLMHPRWEFLRREELIIALAALFGNTLYFIAENTALLHTQSSNVSILVTSAPVFSALILAPIPGGERITIRQAAGYFIAFIGVIMVILNGMLKLKLNPFGDILALLAALTWALYCILIRKSASGHSNFLISRKLMLYGFISATPVVIMEGKPIDWQSLLTPYPLAGLAFLGIVCSALCYILWNSAIKEVGVIRTNYFIYAIPAVTLIAGHIMLNEVITLMGLAGMVIVIAGMVIGTLEKSPGKSLKKEK